MIENLIWMAIGAVIIMFTPPQYEDWLRSWIITQWKNITKKG